MYWLALVFPLAAVLAISLFRFVTTRMGPPGLKDGVAGPVSSVELDSRVRGRLALIVVPALGGILTSVAVGFFNPSIRNSIVDPFAVLLIAPLVSMSAAVLQVGSRLRFAESGSTRHADLVPRTYGAYASRRALALAGVLGLVLFALVLSFAMLAGPDGRSSFYFYGPSFSAGGGGTFPGAAITAPAVLALFLLLSCAWLALRRVSAAPRPSDEGLRSLDAGLRHQSGAVILALTSCAISLTLAILLALAASTYWGVAERVAVDPGTGQLITPDATAIALNLASQVSALLSIIMLVVALATFVHAAAALTRRIVPEPVLEVAS